MAPANNSVFRFLKSIGLSSIAAENEANLVFTVFRSLIEEGPALKVIDEEFTSRVFGGYSQIGGHCQVIDMVLYSGRLDCPSQKFDFFRKQIVAAVNTGVRNGEFNE